MAIMRKLTYTIVSLCLLIMAGGCIGDDGNYVYTAPEEFNPVKISGIEQEYQRESRVDFSIEPVVDGLKEHEKYSFTWYVFSTAQVSGSKRDTIGREKMLSWNVPLKTGEYQLVFVVKNETTQVETIAKSILNVNSGVSRGWYVLKDNGEASDLDIIGFDGVVKADVYSSVNGRKLPGKGVQIASQSSYGYEVPKEDGSMSTKNEAVMIFLTDQDADICDADKLEEVVSFQDMFVVAPETKSPQALFYGPACFFFVNAGKIYNAYAMTPPPHKLGYYTTGTYHIQGNDILAGSSACLMFDNISRSLIIDKGPSNASPVIGFGKHRPEVNPYDCNNMDCELVYMAGRTPKSAKEGIGIFNKSGDYYIAELDKSFESYQNPIISWTPVAAGKEITKSGLFAINANAGNKYIYFVDQNGQIKSYSIHDGVEREQIQTIPVGEKVAFMEHLIYKGYQDEQYHINCFVVLTNSQEGWKLYTYPFVGETGDIVDEPLLKGQGKGYGRHVFYRSKRSL